MRMFSLITIFIVGALVASDAESQQPRRLPERYYPPAGPTISPYLHLFRRDSGAIDNYNLYVRPRQDLSRQLRQQNSQLQSLNRNLQRTERQLQEKPAELAPTGRSSATFMNYSHFYRYGPR